MQPGPILAALVFALSPPAHAEPQRYALDPEHTTVAFMIDHVGYAAVLGVFGEIEGSFTYDLDSQVLSDLEVRVRTASLDTFHAARDAHVRGDDFLDAEAHPVMTFVAMGGTPSGEDAGTVTGELTLLGETRPLTLDVTLNKAGDYPFGHGRFVLGISARGTLDRSAYGMTYGVADGLVGDEVRIIVETEAMRID
ncbi:YceI family protein [uncultured Jannaschia sp.]|uniref:YceI family protein n=1 Tax=uncultured Jannaschia sp. TaxID=293347 RepID=UPI0026231889|nr:YceI family protein [uncultured Jannaschia sp.]